MHTNSFMLISSLIHKYPQSRHTYVTKAAIMYTDICPAASLPALAPSGQEGE